jgi:membrane protease subunit HflC
MKKKSSVFIVIGAVIIAIFVANPFYTIDEGEQAVIVQMGRLINVVTKAGLHFKTPFIDTVVRYPKRIMAWDGDQKSMPTREKQYIWVDVIARWRISDPKQFYESVSNLSSANSKLGEIIDSEVRTVVAENYLRESVRNSNIILDASNKDGVTGLENAVLSIEATGVLPDIAQLIQSPGVNNDPIQKGRRKLAELILERSRRMVGEYGIELIDVVTRQIRYSDELTQSVYARMIKERNQIAQAFRSEGEGKKAEWLGKTDNEKRSILSDAYSQAEKIKGAADADATRIYASAYNRDRSFFEFWRAIESYRTTLPKLDKTLTTNMEYFRYLYSPQGR